MNPGRTLSEQLRLQHLYNARRRIEESEDSSELQMIEVQYDPDYPCFGLIGQPVEHQQHPNQQGGLDLYVNVINFDSGERCFKKLYENSQGLHFKHTGYSPMYLEKFTATGVVIPFQVLLA